MIAHVPGHLCVADVAKVLGISPKAVHRLASRKGWRAVKRPGHREVYYNADDILGTARRELTTSR